MPPTRYTLEVNPKIPKRLARLEELAGNLWYSWDRPTRAIFARMNPALWDSVGHSPKAMLKRIDEQRLLDAASDPAFLDSLTRVLSAFDAYHAEPPFKQNSGGFRPDDLVAYFCAEFGLHESLPLYSGGLGILAGDHCKAASDFHLPFVAIGLLYRQGYFVQTIDAEGKQRAEYHDSEFSDLPIAPVRKEGQELTIELAFPGRRLLCKVWEARIGHVRLYLLDTDLAENNERDRAITYRLYGGDRTTRLEQELVLGVGGVKALAAIGLKPTVWHINEGHAAFMILERLRGLVAESQSYDTAIEAIAANTIFTTHTPVPAGHDQFSDATVLPYLKSCFGELNVMPLARPPTGGDFNMTALAIRGSRYQNGVSRIHGGVSQTLLKDYWPDVSPEENPVGYVTNGVHVTTFLAPEWGEVLDRFLGVGWMHRLAYPGIWEKIRDIPDHIFWSVRQDIKARLLHMIRHRVTLQHTRNHSSESHIERLLRYCDPAKPNVLTIGFGRRFATYKRATLLFNDLDQFRRIVGDKDRPVVFLFSGKAHPADEPGQELIRQLVHMSGQEEFQGRLLFIEGYDLHIARRLVSGVDVWLNNPVHPLEASGTSGMKAGMNGALNLSILDGWWDEGYDGENGWAIKPASPHLDQHRRDREEARTLYELLTDRVVPLYYKRSEGGYSARWIHMAKRSMASLLPRYDASRMLGEYVSKYYLPASRQGHRYAGDGFAGAKSVAAWKARVRAAWPGVAARRLDAPRTRIEFGDSIPVEVAVKLNGLEPADVTVELLLTREVRDAEAVEHVHALAPAGPVADSPAGKAEQRFRLDLKPGLAGRLDYRIRVYPRHELLTHPFELGLATWL
jgi:starch phosphorylase